MLKLNLFESITGKGVENPSRFLRNCGISPVAASRILNNRVQQINFKHLESICLALHCTIDDLFVWIPDQKSAAMSKHPLQKLKRKADRENVNQKIKELPFSKLEEVKKFLDRLNEEEH